MSNQPVKRYTVKELYEEHGFRNSQVVLYENVAALETRCAELEAENRRLEKLLSEHTNPPPRTRQTIDRLFWWCGRSE